MRVRFAGDGRGPEPGGSGPAARGLALGPRRSDIAAPTVGGPASLDEPGAAGGQAVQAGEAGVRWVMTQMSSLAPMKVLLSWQSLH